MKHCFANREQIAMALDEAKLREYSFFPVVGTNDNCIMVANGSAMTLRIEEVQEESELVPFGEIYKIIAK